jgi:hypothetical protein
MDDPGDPGQVLPPARPGTADHLGDPRALTILTTEHWNLLTARSLVYNEAFARSGMFLSFLSATLVVLGLISTATGFSDAFLVIAAVVLALDLFVGLVTIGRVVAASDEDLRYLQGMNRLRHAYLEMVPSIERYFVTSQYDDFDSVAAFYGPPDPSVIRGLLHGFTTAPGMLGVICSAVGGGLAATIALLATHDPGVAGVAAVAGFAALFGVMSVVFYRGANAAVERMPAMFPRPGAAVSETDPE